MLRPESWANRGVTNSVSELFPRTDLEDRRGEENSVSELALRAEAEPRGVEKRSSVCLGEGLEDLDSKSEFVLLDELIWGIL